MGEIKGGVMKINGSMSIAGAGIAALAVAALVVAILAATGIALMDAAEAHSDESVVEACTHPAMDMLSGYDCG